ncbi:plakophilin-4-like [Neolamprologus brichardi]|uniref:plakophilin-4-like n=1 Tax=Neolamprologus brichardi TaxID=32507 RepID=UPI001643E8DF|nr:plakophilin-4-like [Neolamprologus brichardi]
MACVGVCLCIAGVVRLHFSASLCLRVFARARTQSGGMPAPEQSPVTEEGLLLTIRDSSTGRNMEADNTANNILASVKEQELQFERLTRELEVERQIVANQLERCRLGAESPGAGSSSSTSLPDFLLCRVFSDACALGDTKSRVTDSSQSPRYRIRTESEQVSLYSPEQSSLHERSGGNSCSSAQMNSYSDSGYQDASSSYLSSQNLGKAELRVQHSFPGTGTLMRNARAEGQASAQVTTAVPGRAMRRVSSVPSRSHSPAYASSMSPSRGSLRTSVGSAYGSPIVTEPKPLSAIYSTTLPSAQRTSTTGGGSSGSPYNTQKNSPAALRRMGSTNSRSSRTTSPYQASAGSPSGRMGSPLTMVDNVNPPLTKQPTHTSSPVRASMTAVPQHYSSTLPRSVLHNTDPYGPQSYDIYERMTRPDSLAGSSRTTSPYQASAGSPSGRMGSPLTMVDNVNPPLTKQPTHTSSPVRASMTAVPQHYSSTLPRSVLHNTDPYGPQSYDIYERMTRPDSLADALVDGDVQGIRSSYTSQHSQLAPDLRSTISPDRHIAPIYEDRTYKGPLYRSPSHTHQSTLYRSTSGVGSLQRSSSQRSAMTYQRNNYTLNTSATYADPYRSAQYRPSDPNYTRQAVVVDDGAARSPSIDSIQKDPREFAWRDPELTEVIHMLQHHFPSVQANAAAYLQHLCFGDNRVKNEVCRLGGIKHLVDLLDHKVLEVQRNSCGALRNLVYGKTMDDNKIAVRNAGGIPALLRLLRKTVDAEVRELVTESLMCVIGSADPRNKSNLKRNLSSAGEEARKQMRTCEGLIDSLLYVIKACVNTSDFDSKIVENCICTLRNLSYRLELEMTAPRLIEGQEVDGLLARESPSKEVDSSCWGRKKKKKKNSLQEDTWDGVGPIPGFSKSPKGAEMLWHPSVVKPYLTLLAESSNPATLEGAAGSLQNLSAGNWKFAAYIRAAVRKEKGLPILVELLRMDNDRVVCSVATALRNMALDVRNKELIGKYAMRDLVNRLPGGNTTLLSDETVAAICCTLHEVTSKNMENAKALADTGGIEKLVNITKGRGDRSQFSNYQGDNSIHKKQYTGSGKPSPYYYSSPTTEEPRRTQPLYYSDELSRRNYDTYRMYLQHPHGYDDSYLEEVITYPPTFSSQPHGLKSTCNYVDYYATTRTPSFRAEQYPGSPDSWV